MLAGIFSKSGFRNSFWMDYFSNKNAHLKLGFCMHTTQVDLKTAVDEASLRDALGVTNVCTGVHLS